MIVALAPLPLGSNRPLPMAMISGLVGLLVAGWGLRAFLGGVVLARIDRLAALAILFYGAVCLWILAQATRDLPQGAESRGPLLPLV